jgi:assimilatory nitrate reductase catalytic subunit
VVAPGQVFMPFHYVETNSNLVTQSAYDPISREPNFKQCAVQVMRTGPSIQNGQKKTFGAMTWKS